MTITACDVTTEDDPAAAVPVVAGVDTHKDTHHVAVLHAMTGARLGDLQVSATPAGYQRLARFVTSFGILTVIGIEGTNSYGAGLTRYLTAAGALVREVIRPKRAQRRHGKSDPIDAYAAAQQALAEPHNLPFAKTSDGPVEQIRMLMIVRRSAMKARVAAIRQLKSLLVTAPDQVRSRFVALDGGPLINALIATRPGPATTTVTATAGQALRPLARRHQSLTDEITEIDTELRTLVERAAPSMFSTHGFGVVTTATLLIAAGDNPDRLRSQASFAALCGTAPIPASSGKTHRYRLNRGDDRQANWALHQIALVRLSTDPRTKTYAAKLTAAGKSKKDILRCLKRAIARETWHLLVHPAPPPRIDDLRPLRQQQARTLAQAAEHLDTVPARISELERGTRYDPTLATAYRQWLTAA
ncbi:IS110 family transposase [Gordonia sp. HY285]|uniref:IS110 family transposase n=1 Tax=Gordonia liuliyuniae TaxID=2911517 RepID=UPI001F00687D|nr:IS110 family transposase [Gordonia liuliyuniae]MCF8609006.1 IS110 family transposase [Gordonia liuliyuniae]